MTNSKEGEKNKTNDSLSRLISAFDDIIMGVYEFKDGLENPARMKEFLEEVMQRNNLTKRQLYPHLRQALTRKERTPSIEAILSVMIHEKTMIVARLGYWSIILRQAQNVPEEELEVRFGFNPYKLK